MCSAFVVRSAAILVYFAIQSMFVDMISVHVVQTAVVEIIGVTIMSHRCMTAIRAVDMHVPFLFGASLRHNLFSFAEPRSRKDYLRENKSWCAG